MTGNSFGRRFFTRGSTRWGRAGFTSKAANGMLVLEVLSHLSASRKLMREVPDDVVTTAMSWTCARRTHPYGQSSLPARQAHYCRLPLSTACLRSAAVEACDAM
jgi:hypothetical protein